LHLDEAGRTVTLTGRGGKVAAGEHRVFCGNSGTTIRFLTALLTTTTGEPASSILLDGVARMRQRPIGQLVDQLRALGGQIRYDGVEGYPPVAVVPAGLAGGPCRFEGAASSQYISAVLMAAPYARTPVTMALVGPVTSEPYVEMTTRMLEQWGYDGLTETADGGRMLTLAPGRYQPRDYAIEPDASNASYFLAAAAITKGSSITIEGLGKGSLQGDIALADVLHQMGAGLAFGRDFVTVTGTGELHGIAIDMNHIPDMVQTLAVVALFADGPTHITNVANLRIKETDRLAALEAELVKLGATVQTTADSITITPTAKVAEIGEQIQQAKRYRLRRTTITAWGWRLRSRGCAFRGWRFSIRAVRRRHIQNILRIWNGRWGWVAAVKRPDCGFYPQISQICTDYAI
ncbi:MAG: 3-phosphoshikimate 1-carboxyvinyltransferase, partial [Phycisphaerae bacterium]